MATIALQTSLLTILLKIGNASLDFAVVLDFQPSGKSEKCVLGEETLTRMPRLAGQVKTTVWHLKIFPGNQWHSGRDLDNRE